MSKSPVPFCSVEQVTEFISRKDLEGWCIDARDLQKAGGTLDDDDKTKLINQFVAAAILTATSMAASKLAVVYDASLLIFEKPSDVPEVIQQNTLFLARYNLVMRRMGSVPENYINQFRLSYEDPVEYFDGIAKGRTRIVELDRKKELTKNTAVQRAYLNVNTKPCNDPLKNFY